MINTPPIVTSSALRIQCYGRRVATIVLAYFVSAKLAFWILHLGTQAISSVLYPPIGISLAALLLWGDSVWPGVFLGAILFAYSLDGMTWQTAGIAALGNTIEVLVAVSLLRKAGFQNNLNRIRDVTALVGLGAIVATSLNATINTWNGAISGLTPAYALPNQWFLVWVGDGVSILVFTPIILLFAPASQASQEDFGTRLRQIWQRRRQLRRTVLEGGLWLGLLCILLVSHWLAACGLFQSLAQRLDPAISRSLLRNLAVLYIVWAVLRLGQRGAVLSAAIVAGIAIWVVAIDPPTHPVPIEFPSALFELQLFIGLMITLALVLSAAIMARKTAQERLRQQMEREKLLAESMLRIQRSLDVAEVLQTTVAEVRQFLAADRVFINVLDTEGYSQVTAESVAPGWRSVLGQRSPIQVQEEVTALFATASVRAHADTDRMVKSPMLRLFYEEGQIKASVGIALQVGQKLYGILHVNQCSGPRVWQSIELELLQSLATQVELALQQGCLYQQTQRFATHLEAQVQERTQQLQENMQQLQALNQVKDTLLHAVAHDLRTPIVGMVMLLNQLRQNTADPLPVPQTVVDRLVKSGDRQLSLIQSLLNDNASGSQTLRLNYRLIHWPTLVREMLKDLEPVLQEHRIAVDHQVPENLPELMADPIHLRRVLENLITNTKGHNPPGITIAIQSEVDFTTPPALICTIVDNGVGIPIDQQAQLFKKPYLRGQHNQHRTGLGLGLFLCAQVIQAHQGQIGVASPPQGASFWFRIPIEPPKEGTTIERQVGSTSEST